MIVGLKRRKTSKDFYDLGVTTPKRSYYKCRVHWVGGKRIVDRFVLVRTFTPFILNRWFRHERHYIWKRVDLIEKICDETKPANCKNDKCPHRFRCFTTKIGG